MRLIGKDISIFSVGGTSYLTTLKSATFDVDYDEQENSAIMDAFHFTELTKQDWTCEFSLQANDAAYPAVLTAMQAGTEVAISGKGSVSGTGTNLTIAGTGIIKRFGVGFEDNAQEYNFTVRPRSLLVISAT